VALDILEEALSEVEAEHQRTAELAGVGA